MADLRLGNSNNQPRVTQTSQATQPKEEENKPVQRNDQPERDTVEISRSEQVKENRRQRQAPATEVTTQPTERNEQTRVHRDERTGVNITYQDETGKSEVTTSHTGVNQDVLRLDVVEDPETGDGKIIEAAKTNDGGTTTIAVDTEGITINEFDANGNYHSEPQVINTDETLVELQKANEGHVEELQDNLDDRRSHMGWFGRFNDMLNNNGISPEREEEIKGQWWNPQNWLPKQSNGTEYAQEQVSELRDNVMAGREYAASGDAAGYMNYHEELTGQSFLDSVVNLRDGTIDDPEANPFRGSEADRAIKRVEQAEKQGVSNLTTLGTVAIGTAGVALAPFTGGTSLLLTAGSCALLKGGMYTLDRVTSEQGGESFEAGEFWRATGSGAIDGVLSFAGPFASKGGGALLGRFGANATTQAIAGGTSMGMLYGGGTYTSNQTYKGEAIDPGALVTSTAIGGVTGGTMSAASQGLNHIVASALPDEQIAALTPDENLAQAAGTVDDSLDDFINPANDAWDVSRPNPTLAASQANPIDDLAQVSDDFLNADDVWNIASTADDSLDDFINPANDAWDVSQPNPTLAASQANPIDDLAQVSDDFLDPNYDVWGTPSQAPVPPAHTEPIPPRSLLDRIFHRRPAVDVTDETVTATNAQGDMFTSFRNRASNAGHAVQERIIQTKEGIVRFAQDGKVYVNDRLANPQVSEAMRQRYQGLMEGTIADDSINDQLLTMTDQQWQRYYAGESI